MTIFLILFLCIFNLNFHQGAGWDCMTELSVNLQSSTEIYFIEPYYNYCKLVVSFSETVQVESSLYSVSWLHNLETLPYTNNTADTNTALEYIKYDIRNKEKIVSFSVFNSMERLMDYGDSERKTVLDLKLYFTFSANETCILQIQHDLVDANTAVPTFEKNDYTLSLIETFPVGLIISGLSVNAWDYDALSPNSQFEVAVDSECPLKSTNTSYVSFQGLPVSLSFMLKEKLDYDSMNDPFQLNCSINLEDKGIPPLHSSPAIITLIVEPYPDEKPVFSSDFYTGTLQDSSVNSVIPISPEILATNKDVPPSKEIVYRIISVDNNPVGSYNYFTIDNSTGVVTVAKEIDETFQSWGPAKLIVVAYDEYNQYENALLTINMPLEESDELHFDTSIYNVEILVESEDRQFAVHAESSSGYFVEYKFVQNNSPGLDYFEIGKSTGIISETTMAAPGLYTLIVSADDEIATAISTVNIYIIDYLKDGSIIPESIISLTVEENFEGPIYNVSVEGEFTYCILGVDPSYYERNFEVSSNGVLSLIYGLNAEESQIVLVKVGLYEGVSECSISSDFYTFSQRNEILLNLTVGDVNEYVPYFKDAHGDDLYYSITLYYPSIIQLQKCMPTLMLSKILEVVDSDVKPNHTISLSYSPPQLFEIDSESVEIYYLNNLPAPEYLNTYFDIIVEDPPFSQRLDVQVRELSLEYIFTIKLEKVRLNEIQERLDFISREANIYLILVYWSLVEGYNTGSSEFWDINAHVYAMDYRLSYKLSIEDVNSYLGYSIYSYLVAQPFTDLIYFSEENIPSESESYKTATIALGCVIGFVICVLVVIYVYQSYYRKKSKKYGNVSTLGQAYANENFKSDSESNERIQSVETVLGDTTTSSPKSHDDSLGKSSLSKIEGENIEMVSSVDQPGPSHLGQTQLDKINNDNDDSSECVENIFGKNSDSLFPSTDHVDEPNKFGTTTDALSSNENMGESKDAVSYPSLEESGSNG